jgi:peptidoglycan/LPS O-acetylase OafA/YrhL
MELSQALSLRRMNYRPEVDGLRALAVLSVVLYHAQVPIVRGGFLGVDVFFVISGYLITYIIQRGLESNNFSIYQFYIRRIRRIIPALLVMTAMTALPAYLLLLPDDMENYGQSIVATTLSANNILLYLTRSYFALEAEFKPLIHTWSLGVEEQYYLVVPLLMWTAFYLARRRGVFLSVLLISLFSFWISTILRVSDADANFYLIFTRAWELGIGAGAALLQRKVGAFRANASAGLALLGLGVVLASFLVFEDSWHLPGPATALPVLGTALTLMFANERNLVGRILSLRPVVFVGLISYSTYLYHQPIFTFARIASLEPPSPILLLALTPLILGLSYLSWRFVEQPFRDSRRVSTRRLLTLVGTTSAALLAIGLTFHLTSGFYSQRPELASGDPGFGTGQNTAFNTRPYELLGVEFHEPRPRVLILGDSFARDVVNMGIESGALRREQISYGEMEECEGLPPRYAELAAHADYIVLGSGPGPAEFLCFRAVVERLRAISAARIVMIGTKGFGYNNNAVMLLPEEIRYSYRVRPQAGLIEADQAARRAFADIDYVSILDLITDGESRVPVFTPERRFISQDRKHLTSAGAHYLGSLLFRQPALARMTAVAYPPH